ncbi:hypothetical protein V6N13_099822 [Hibiscus sabdariffa]
MPHHHHWINKYGKVHLSWYGARAQLKIAEPELVKEVLRNSEKVFPKRKPSYFIEKILGDGLASTESEKWSRQRKLANHAFHGESLKNMTRAMISSVETILARQSKNRGDGGIRYSKPGFRKAGQTKNHYHDHQRNATVVSSYKRCSM